MHVRPLGVACGMRMGAMRVGDMRVGDMGMRLAERARGGAFRRAAGDLVLRPGKSVRNNRTDGPCATTALRAAAKALIDVGGGARATRSRCDAGLDLAV